MGGPDLASRYAWMRDILGVFREQGIGWSYWNYKNLDFGIISVGERLFERSPQYDNAARVDVELLDILRAS
jgi:hypothetical protein